MGKSTAGHIIIKKSRGVRGTRQYFSDVDKTDSKPAFCHPQRIQKFKEEVERQRKVVKRANVTDDRMDEAVLTLKKHEKRLSEIEDSRVKADEIVKEHGDKIRERCEELGKYIAQETPTVEQETKRRVNPHIQLAKEQGALGEAKKEYIIHKRALGEESNVSYLQRDK